MLNYIIDDIYIYSDDSDGDGSENENSKDNSNYKRYVRSSIKNFFFC